MAGLGLWVYSWVSEGNLVPNSQVTEKLELLDALQLPAALVDAMGRILEVTKAFNETFGAAHPCRSLEDLTDKEHAAELVHEWCKLCTDSQSSVNFYERNGRRRWTLSVAAASEDAGSPLIWLAVASRQSSAASFKGDHLPREPISGIDSALQSALTAGSMAVWEWSPASDRAIWSSRLYELLELPAGSGIENGARFLSFVHPDDADVGQSLITSIGATGEIPPTRFRIVTAQGNTRWLLSCAYANRDQSGKIITVTGVNVDVTAEEQSRQDLLQALQRADERAAILQSVMDHAPIGIAVAFDGDENLNFVSRAGSAMIGSANGGEKEWDAWNVYHLDGKTVAKKEEMALHRAVAGEIVRDEDWLLRAADGRLIPVRCHAGPICDSRGQKVGGIVAWYDVTHFKQAEAQRLELLRAEMKARSAAEEAGKAKDQFLAILSHELRTPLSAIVSWCEVLLMKKADEKVAERALKSIQRNAYTQARLVDDLLDISRVTAGKLELRMETCDLSEIATLAIETVRNQATERNIDIREELAPQLPVLGDPVRLRQVAWNLLVNAIKFSASGTSIAISACRDGDDAVLQVSDAGEGISAELLPHIFDRFRQGSTSDGASRSGLGLGLAIVQFIVNRHGGTVSATSEGVGRGAQFTVRLPLL